MTYVDIAIIAAGIVCFFVFLFSPRFKEYIISMALGLTAFAAVNATSLITGASIRATAGSLGAACFFGLPGVIVSLLTGII